MSAKWRRTILLFLCFTLMMGEATHANAASDCRVIRAEGASVLKDCREGLRSFALTIRDFKRRALLNAHGGFIFECPIRWMCTDEIDVAGAYIDQRSWREGGGDAAAVTEALLGVLLANRIHIRPIQTCDVFDLEIAGIVGRAVCYRFSNIPLNTVAVVTAADDVAFVLVFQSAQEWSIFRANLQSVSTLFAIERASGDRALSRWFR